jgi:hypothetical protein
LKRLDIRISHHFISASPAYYTSFDFSAADDERLTSADPATSIRASSRFVEARVDAIQS